jgi:uncharacterized protein (DUF362 family)/Pyruvate/2-oxoacid:ferredoxin oxidoreductase delta subunit
VRAQHGPQLASALQRALQPFGGWEAIVRPGERIAVKVNLLRAAAPEQAVTTHPETLREVLRGLKAAGARPFVADSPGGPNPAAKVARAWRVSGIATVCAEEQVQLVDVDSDPAELVCPEGRLFRSFPVGRPFLEADGMVQVGPLKTHVLMRLTGAVKLTFGCIPGLSKAALHVRASRREDFADMLLDLHLGLHPRFSVMDAILAMEGQGPGGGEPRELGSLFAAADALALDAALADVTAHRRADVYVLAAGARRGLIDLDDPYRLVGDPIEPVLDFVPAVKDAEGMVPGRFRGLARRLLTARPRLTRPSECSRCGDCAAICGAQAIRLAPNPVIDDDACVRCYACAEVCPSGALETDVPPLARLLSRRRRGE